MSRILIGVNATEGSAVALDWAAAECRLRDGELLLVHVPPPQTDQSLIWSDERARPVQAGSAMQLGDLAVTTRAAYPDLVVQTLLGHGEPADTLIDLSALADLLILGTTGLAGNLISLLGSVSSRVAAQAHCPVVIVPRQPAVRSAQAAEPTIVVGIADTAAGEGALRFAFDEAGRRRISVTAVQAWDPDQAGPTPASGTSEAAEQAELERRLLAKLAAVRADHPGVAATASLQRGHPAEVMLRAARDAQLVVLGAHHSDNRWSSRLGPVPQTVLHHTGCPVVLVGTPQHGAAREQALRRAQRMYPAHLE
jgi:nucleotide-binding universal stress UspA family protein